LVSNWCQIAPTWPVYPTHPIYNRLSVYNLRFYRFHGMEEVTGSIPVRSTNQTNNLDGHGFLNLDSGYPLSGRTPRAASTASISLEAFQRCQAHLERFSHLRGILPRLWCVRWYSTVFSLISGWYLGNLSRNAPADMGSIGWVFFAAQLVGLAINWKSFAPSAVIPGLLLSSS
jgi:hypothetical protein